MSDHLSNHIAGMDDHLRCCHLVTLTVDICVQHGGRESLRRTGLSAAVEPCSTCRLSAMLDLLRVWTTHEEH